MKTTPKERASELIKESLEKSHTIDEAKQLAKHFAYEMLDALEWQYFESTAEEFASDSKFWNEVIKEIIDYK